jgi:hypothetical protein
MSQMRGSNFFHASNPGNHGPEKEQHLCNYYSCQLITTGVY